MQTIDDIDRQARRGSVAAIIQILNDHFANSSIRTRAVLDQGILQLLCEAPTADQLPKEHVIEQVKAALEAISPRGINKVKINGRIVKEQQLLWLEEIKRNPEQQLLWSELITLKKLNPAVRLWQDLRSPRQRNPFQESSRAKKGNNPAFWRGLVGGASLCILLVGIGWALQDWLGLDVQLRSSSQSETEPPAPDTPAPDAPAPDAPAPDTQTPDAAPPPVPPEQDPFAQAVRIAESASQDGQTATSAADWLDLASRWRRASDLMAEVPPEDNRYELARERVQSYRQNSTYALSRSEALQVEAEAEAE